MSIKECFTSRYVTGFLMEVDFSQLEVVALAILSKDPVLIKDLLDGTDMHRVRAAELFGINEWEVTAEQRQLAKQLSFQLQYGAGAKSLAERNSIPASVAANFITNYYARYVRVWDWQQEVAEKVRYSRAPSDKHTELGVPRGVGVWDSPTGRMYKFYEYDGWKRGEVNFSPTEMKNYPVQGFATGDIMALYRGRLYRHVINNRPVGVHLINTVHDSVMFDVLDVDVMLQVNQMCADQATRLPKLLKDLWGIDCPVPFKVECKYGKTWATMVKLSEGN